MTDSPAPASPEAEDALPDFTPVPLARSRHDGWTPERQRGFIAALAEYGTIATAARAVGMSITSAYNLRRRAGAESFALAWDIVLDQARERSFALIKGQFLSGTPRARFYRGRYVGTVRRHETRIALAILRAVYATPPRS